MCEAARVSRWTTQFHQSVLADLIPFGSTISAKRYFIERRFFSSLFVSKYLPLDVRVAFYAITLTNIEVRREDVTYWRLRRGFLADFVKEIATVFLRIDLYRSGFCEILKGGLFGHF